ncbi:MAG TPA: branched-chain amino acid ABC transporter permease [Ramlibacter sp.]|nr:branched-chain amino acid ABC transporter permease [Ramlibacter sp.]
MRTRTFKESTAGLNALLPYRDGWVWYGLLALALMALPMVAPNYVVNIAVGILIATIGAVGLNLVTGSAGLISLGHAGFLALGAYTCGILLTDYQWALLPAMFAAGVVSAFASLIVGVPSLRLKGLYLAITTLAFSIITTTLIVEASSLTGGSSGKAVTRPALFGLSLESGTAIYYLALAVAVITVLVALNLLRMRVGRAWNAIRDYDIAASLMGVNVRLYKLLAFMVSAFITGVAGSVLALHLRYLNIDSFALIASIEVLAMVIVGGLGSVRGAVLGAILITLLPEISGRIFALAGGSLQNMSSANLPELKGVIYALIIMVFLRFEPDGLAARWGHIKRFWSDWPYSRRPT